MPKVHRYIFRIDFDISYDMLDQQGKILKFLVDADDWHSVGQLSGERTLKAAYGDKSERKEFTVDPVTINGVYQSYEGIEFGQLSESKAFNEFSSLLQKYCDEFKIHKVARVGFRTILFDYYGDNFGNHLDKFWKNFRPNFLKDFSDAKAKARDVGLIVEGEYEDELNYRVHFGTFFEGDFGKTLKGADSPLLSNKQYHMTVDFDLYDKGINFQGVTLKKWMRDKWQHIDKFMLNLKSSMTES